MEFSTSLTFRAVTLPLQTCVRRPFGLDTALTSFPSPPSPGKDTWTFREEVPKGDEFHHGSLH